MKIKKGDNVKVTAGKNRGKSGKVTQVLPALDRIVVDGINLMTKNMKPRRSGEKGQKLEFASPLRAANVALICPKCSKPTRVGLKVLEGGKRVRICRKCKETVE